jgi:DNA invertase Pin-like site-specific DNA recombinase
MRRAIIYTRFSPRRNAEESESCELQLAHCERYAQDHGYEVASVHHDRDVSGADEYREILWKSIDGLRKGDVLLVYKRDRLARNVYLAEQINRAVSHKGGTIEAVSGDVEGNGPEHTMIRQVLASIAEYERKLIGQRTRHAMRMRQQNGERMGRYAPYGWALDPADPRRMIANDAERQALAAVRQMHAEQAGATAIAKALNRDMPGAARFGKWTARTVKKIIEREG